jgi:drug/metabolite transporter (DMT)-like permease
VTAVLLAAASALVWGSADYCGGRATRGGTALGVTVASQILGLPVLAIALLVLPGHAYLVDLAWGVGAGLAGLIGIVLLYHGLSSGAMAVVAPITAVMGALVPMGVGLVTEEAPSAPALIGAFCAVVAIALVSLGPADRAARAGSASVAGRAHVAGGPAVAVPDPLAVPASVLDPVDTDVVAPRRRRVPVVVVALASGTAFGVFFSLLAQTHPDSGMWPLVGARGASIVVGLVLVAAVGASLRTPAKVWVALAGAGDIAANALFLVAVWHGLLSVVAPIAALYPVSTVLLALTLDRERVRPVQIAGLGFAAAALVLTAF